MRTYLLLALGLLSGCGTRGPKFKNPVVVTADNSPIYQNLDAKSRVIAVADKGDTLEYDGAFPVGLGDTVLCRINPDARYGRFKSDDKSGYINRKALSVSKAILAKEKAGKLHELPATLEDSPKHLRAR